MMTEQTISLITLGVKNVARARMFYQQLGWHATDDSNDNIAFIPLSGHMTLGLYPQTELSADSGLHTPAPGGITLALNARSREEVDEKIAFVKSLGATVLKEPFETVWGGYVCYFADLDGHPWEITHAPMIPLRDDNSLDL